MRYGLSLLVCFALVACAQAQDCPNGKCPYVRQPVQAVVNVATAPVRAVTTSCGQSTQQAGPVRRFFRKLFAR